MSKFYVYIICCKDGTLYTGSTNDLDKRMAAHNTGAGAKYTRGRFPVSLVYVEQVESRGSALSRERAIKKLSRLQKLKLITKNQVDYKESS